MLFVIAGYLGVRQLRAYKAQNMERRQAWLEAGNADGQKSAATARNVQPVEVRVGVYVTHIGEFSLKEDSWVANFDIWFRWTGKAVSPGETFWLVNGEVQSREKREAYVVAGEHYERYHVKARIGNYFDPTRFPFADEPLTLEIEDAIHSAETLRFVADTQDSGVSATAVLRELKIAQSLLTVKAQDYGSRFGDPRRSESTRRVHSRVVFAILLNHPGGMFHLKMFHALFVAVAIAVLAFFIKPTHVDPRFGLPVGAAFTAVANIIATGALLPRADGLVLADMVNSVGFVTIFLTLVQSAISLYFFDTLGKEKLSRFFDHVSFVVFFVGYVVVNLALPMAARS
ncbi:MAG: hypothetical protein ACREQ2_10110 [Candidatus Binatia bacterium]